MKTSNGVLKELRRTSPRLVRHLLSILLRLVVKSDGVRKLVWHTWHKSSIAYRLQLNPMVRKKLVWHKLYIAYRSQPIPMVSLLKSVQIHPIHLGNAPYPMVLLIINALKRSIYLAYSPVLVGLRKPKPVVRLSFDLIYFQYRQINVKR